MTEECVYVFHMIRVGDIVYCTNHVNRLLTETEMQSVFFEVRTKVLDAFRTKDLDLAAVRLTAVCGL
jgi:hypothetical protein